MGVPTTILGLYKAGGGSEGVNGDDEVADIDKINDNFDIIDAAVGVTPCSSSTYPVKPYLRQIVFVSDLDDLQRWNGSKWVSIIPTRLSDASMKSNYYTRAQLGGADGSGALDSRYWTQGQLLTGKKLDSVYPNKTISGSVSQEMLPFRAAGGSDTVTNFALDSGTGKWVGTKTVTFPTGRFNDCPGAPAIFGTATSADPMGATVTEISTTKTQSTLQISRRNNFDTGFQWFAYRSINS